MSKWSALSSAVAAAAVALFGVVGAAWSMDEDCGRLENSFGPFDYRTFKERDVVEKFHFTPRVENLRGGQTSSTPSGDLSYTLRAMPNHHRALIAMMRLGEKEKTPKPQDSPYSIACWFERAEAFQPGDAIVKGLYGVYLVRADKPREGAAKLQEARGMAGNNANIHYNLGLALIDLNRYDEALESAHKAYALGFPLPGLRDKLKRAGKWRDVSVELDGTPSEAVPQDRSASKPKK